MEKELAYAKVNAQDEKQLKEHIAKIAMLCDLLLDSEVDMITHTTPQAKNSVSEGKPLEVSNTESVTDDPYDIFDF